MRNNGTCYSGIAPGRRHRCLTSTRIRNVTAIVQSLSKNRPKQVISALLKDKVKKIATSEDNHEMALVSFRGDKPTRVSVNSSKRKKVMTGQNLFSGNDIQKVQSILIVLKSNVGVSIDDSNNTS